MRRAWAAAFALAAATGCTSSRPAAPSAAPTSNDAPAAPISEAPTAGEPVDCSLLPVPGSAIVTYATHDCWVVRDNTIGNPDVVFLGGVDPDTRTTGILLYARFDVPDENLRTVRLPRHGDLTITLARKTFACVRAKDGTRWRFDVPTLRLAAAPRGC